MKRAYKNLRECVFTAPFLLSDISDKKLLKIAASYLPYSTGMEIECSWKISEYNDYYFASSHIPVYFSYNQPKGIMAFNHDIDEKRWRIPNGIPGMLALYNICEWMKENCLLNPLSGIHYHVDCSECNSDVMYNWINYLQAGKEWILKELDEWEYKGNYNDREVGRGHVWLRTGIIHKTLEFRIGEMSFDYSVLMKRIAHCNDIVRRIKKQIKTR